MQKFLIKRLLGALIFLTGLGLVLWFIYIQIWPNESYRTIFRGTGQLIIVASAFLILGWKWMWCEGKGIDEITAPDLKCPELEHAFARARSTITKFIEKADKGIDGAFIKFPLQTPQGLTEHIWGYVHFYRDGRFNVSLANYPVDEQQSADGRRDVLLEDVEDWQIMNPDGTIHGAYTLIALFEYHEGRGVKLTPKMQKQKAQLLDAR